MISGGCANLTRANAEFGRKAQSARCADVWYDEHLFRGAAMGPVGIETLVQEWTELGFEPVVSVEGKRVWNDCCVTERMFGGPTLPCNWLELTDDGHPAFLKGTEPGEIVGRGTA